jgi:hypothetical protein
MGWIFSQTDTSESGHIITIAIGQQQRSAAAAMLARAGAFSILGFRFDGPAGHRR